jgi:hypothetical protein
VKPRANAERAQRCIDRLSARIDAQALRPGADAPHLVSTVGAFHHAAGSLEGRIRQRGAWWSVADYRAELRILALIVRTHATMVRQRGLVLAQQPRLELRVQPMKPKWRRRHC